MARLKLAGVTILTCPNTAPVLELLRMTSIQGEKIMILPGLKKLSAKGRTGRASAARAKRSSARKR
jgi:hypothetical protein